MRGAPRGESEPGVRYLQRALGLLDALQSGSRGGKELSDLLELPRSTTFRLLAELEAYGYVRRVGPGSFALSLKVVEMAGRVLDSLDIRTIGHDMLVEVNRFTDLAAHLAVREGLTAVVVDRVESAAAIRLNIPLGRRMPLYAGASSKVLLAHAPPEVIEAVLNEPFEKLANGMVTSGDRLLEELETIRRRGYARSEAEVYERARAIAAPIYNARGEVVAALSVGGLARRIKLSDRAIIDEVQAAARSISADLGYQRTIHLRPRQPTRGAETESKVSKRSSEHPTALGPATGNTAAAAPG